MTRFTSLRARLVGTVFVALVPAWVVMYLFAYDPPWLRFGAGILALAAAWYGGEHFILRQVRIIVRVTKCLATQDLSVRTGLEREKGELGDLAANIDQMASALQQKAREREAAEKALMCKALQQTVVSALGQFALVSKDLHELLTQAALMVSQTLEIEYSAIFKVATRPGSLKLHAGVGWESESKPSLTIRPAADSILEYVLRTGEPVTFRDYENEAGLKVEEELLARGARSGVAVPITAQGAAFGVLAAHTTHYRTFTEDEVHFMLAVATILAISIARHRAESELATLAAFAQLNPNPAMELNERCEVTYFNDAARRLVSSFGKKAPADLLPEECAVIVAECLAGNVPLLNYEVTVDRRTLAWSFHPVASSRVVHVYIAELTERLNLEAQLRQSQKMECVGQLAAGVAHDFNNMLTIIQGHSGLLLVKPTLPEDVKECVQAVYFASERAAVLTRQLLMFSRKNVIQPRELDICEVVTSTSKLLQRLLGENITLTIHCSANIPCVHADTGMIEQVIMNLAVNARDAMPNGGTIEISAEPKVIDIDYAQTHPEARPGLFVRLSVTDTGSGIDAATLPRIFEPFFTTKEVGKGTGLGLATVYGIIRQHSGWIDVDTEVGRGTTFSVFFPAHVKKASRREQSFPNAPLPTGRETILLVEDEPALRELACSILQDCGYNVIDAPSGAEAIRIWKYKKDMIDLVVTDMIMPDGVSGMDLARHITASRPEVKVIFASGYTMDDFDSRFLENGRSIFIQKPYTHMTLTKAVRDCLDKSPVLEHAM